MSDKDKYLLFDERARAGLGTENAECLDLCNDEDKAIEMAEGYINVVAIYSYNIDGYDLVDEQWERDV